MSRSSWSTPRRAAALPRRTRRSSRRCRPALRRLVVHNKIDLAGLAPAVEAGGAAGTSRRIGASGAPGLPVREDGCGHRAPAAGDPRPRRSPRGHGGSVPRARASPRGAARRGRATRRGGAARRRREAAAGAAGRGPARGAHGAGDDRRRIHAGRSARARSFRGSASANERIGRHADARPDSHWPSSSDGPAAVPARRFRGCWARC